MKSLRGEIRHTSGVIYFLENGASSEVPFFLYKENHAIVAWFEKGSADDYKANKRQAKNVFVRKTPSGRVVKRREGIE